MFKEMAMNFVQRVLDLALIRANCPARLTNVLTRSSSVPSLKKNFGCGMWSSRDESAQLATDEVSRPFRSSISDPLSTALDPEQLASGEDISGCDFGPHCRAQDVVVLDPVRREDEDTLVREIGLEHDGILAGDFDLFISAELEVTSTTTAPGPGLRSVAFRVPLTGLVGMAMTRTTPFTQLTTYRFGPGAKVLPGGGAISSPLPAAANGLGCQVIAFGVWRSGRSCRSSSKARRTLRLSSSSV